MRDAQARSLAHGARKRPRVRSCEDASRRFLLACCRRGRACRVRRLAVHRPPDRVLGLSQCAVLFNAQQRSRGAHVREKERDRRRVLHVRERAAAPAREAGVAVEGRDRVADDARDVIRAAKKFQVITDARVAHRSAREEGRAQQRAPATPASRQRERLGWATGLCRACDADDPMPAGTLPIACGMCDERTRMGGSHECARSRCTSGEQRELCGVTRPSRRTSLEDVDKGGRATRAALANRSDFIFRVDREQAATSQPLLRRVAPARIPLPTARRAHRHQREQRRAVLRLPARRAARAVLRRRSAVLARTPQDRRV